MCQWFPDRQTWTRIVLIWLVAFGSMGFGLYEADGQTTTKRNDLITVNAPERLATYADTVVGHATAALRALNKETADALMVPIDFDVVETQEEFTERSNGEGENTLAVARGWKQEVLINYEAMSRSGADKIRQVLVHELAHVYLEVRCLAPVPRWVHEGVAQDIAGDWPEIPGDMTMAISAYTGGLIPLRDLVHTFPVGPDRRNQAYGESLSAVRFLVQQDHEGSLPAFLAAIRGEAGKDYLKSLGGTVSLDAFELKWRSELKSPLFAVSVLVSSSFFWGLAAVLLVVVWFIKRRGNQKLRQQWAREEAMTGEFESIIDQIERYDEAAAEDTDPSWQGNLMPEETPYDRYLAEKEETENDNDGDGVAPWR